MPRSPLPLRYSQRGFHPIGIWPNLTPSDEIASAVTRPPSFSTVVEAVSPTPHDVEPVLTSEGVFPEDWHPDPATWGMARIEESLFTMHYVFKLALFYLRKNFGNSWYDFWTKRSKGYRALKKALKEAISFLANYREIAVENDSLRVAFDNMTQSIVRTVVRDLKAKDGRDFILLAQSVSASPRVIKSLLKLRRTDISTIPGLGDAWANSASQVTLGTNSMRSVPATD